MRGYFDATPGAEGEVIDGVPLGRIGDLEDVPHAVLFLAPEQGSFVAGHGLFVDGGVATI